MITIEDADHRVDAGSPIEHLGSVTLHQAARDDDPLELALVLSIDRFPDDRERFVLAGLEESTGVDHDGVMGL